MPPLPTQPAKSVPIVPDIPSDFPLTFANHATIQATDNEVVVTFFQVSPPFGELQKIKKVDGQPVIRLVFTHNFAQQVAGIFAGMLQKPSPEK